MNLEILSYDDAPIRIILKDGRPWFCAADVCRALDIAKASNAVAKFSVDEKGAHRVGTLGGDQELLFVSEAGLYRLIFRSDKACAAKFQHWVFHEVLPTIRKTGQFRSAGAPVAAPAPSLQAAEVSLLEYVLTANLDYRLSLKLAREVRSAARALGQRKPSKGRETFPIDLVDWVKKGLPLPVLTMADAMKEDFATLIEEWAAQGNHRWGFAALLAFAREKALFKSLLSSYPDRSDAQRAAFGKYLVGQNGTVVDGRRFLVIGKNRQRHYALFPALQEVQRRLGSVEVAA